MTKIRALSLIRSRRVIGLVAFIALTTTTLADSPGRGRTASFEVRYLRFIINHHASAVRMTELAAGTDVTRDPGLNAGEGTSPTPSFPPTPGKTSLDEIRSMARRENRMQREEIAAALHMLREWYGETFTPGIPPEGQRLIQYLEAAPAGPEFDRAFLQGLSWHHYMSLQASVDCQVNRELTHDELDRYCRGIVHAQISAIQDMRELLCKRFGFCDFQPSEVPR